LRLRRGRCCLFNELDQSSKGLEGRCEAGRQLRRALWEGSAKQCGEGLVAWPDG
jgi:hypothetical protein